MFTDLFRAIGGRVVAVVAGGIVTLLTGIGLEVDADGVARISEGVNLIGLTIFTSVYAFVHKLLNRWLNPADTAVVPESTGARLL